MNQKHIETIYKAYYPKDDKCVFTAHTASQICKDILDKETKKLKERLAEKQSSIVTLSKGINGYIKDLNKLEKKMQQKEKELIDLKKQLEVAKEFTFNRRKL